MCYTCYFLLLHSKYSVAYVKVISNIPEGTTHMVAQPEKVRVSVDYESLAQRGVAVVSPIYINEYLIADPRPQVDTFLVEPFKAHWTKRQGKR